MSKSRTKKSRSKKTRSPKSRFSRSPSSDSPPRRSRSRALSLSLIAAAVLVAAFGAHLMGLPGEPRIEPAPHAAHSAMSFTDVAVQTREFMAYNRRIKLDSAQEAVKRDALTRIRAACCSDYPAYTCCCQCNLSRTVWGLANHLIADEGFGAEQVSAAVTDWLNFVNPQGFGGNACFEGGCGRSFAKDGCGGMEEAHLVL